MPTPNPLQLFRKEAQEHRTSRLEGDVVLPQHSALIVGAATSIFAVLSIFAFLRFGNYAPRQTSTGYLAPQSGLVKVLPQRLGVVTAVKVKDGDRVQAGQTLALVSVEQTLSEGGGAQSRMLDELKEQEKRECLDFCV